MADQDPRPPVVLRGGTVLTMDDAQPVLPGADVLVVGRPDRRGRPGLEVPEGTVEIDASGGIVMPGMIDTHRHMWQTAMRGYGADWTLTQYFVWYYLESGKHFRPEDVHAGNLLAAVEAIDAGVTTCVDWSHGLQTVDHADAAVDALQAVPGRFVLAYGNIQQAPCGVVGLAGVPRLRRAGGSPATTCSASRWPSTSPATRSFPEKGAFEVARELGVPVTTHAGVWGATNDDGIRLMHDNGFMTPETIYVHAATLSADSYQRIAATGGSVSVSTESEQSAGQGYPPTWALRAHGIPVSLSMDTSVWWSGDLFSAMRTTLGADRSREHLEAHAKGDTVTHSACAPSTSSTGPPAAARRRSAATPTWAASRSARRPTWCCSRTTHSPVSFPVLNPYGHVAFQAQRGDVHTVLVDGRVVKHDNGWSGSTCGGPRARSRRRSSTCAPRWARRHGQKGMNPDVPETALVDNPYQYTDYKG